MSVAKVLNRKLSLFVLAIFALVAQPFYGLVQNQVASAAPATLHGPVNVAVSGTAPYKSTPINTSGHTATKLKFSYDAEELDSGDIFTYGYEISGVETNIGVINGLNESGVNAATDETGVVDVAVPANSVLEIFARVSANTQSDVVNITDLTVDGEQAPPPAPVCTYDFPADKMWEINWGTQVSNRNDAPTFTKNSHGGIVALNDGPVPSYMANHPNWQWLYLRENNGESQNIKYSFADGTIRTANITFSEVNGCQIPTIVWGMTPNQAPKFIIDPSTKNVKKLSDIRFILTDETGVQKSQVNIRNSSGEGVEKYIRPNGASNAIPLAHVSGNVWKLNLSGMNDNLPDDSYEFRARSTDIAGVTGYSDWKSSVLIDNVAPTFAITSPTNGSIIAGTQRIVVDIKDPSSITKILFSLDGKAYGPQLIKGAGDTWYIDIDTTTLADGLKRISLRATDGAGNTRYWNNNANNVQHSFTVDNTAPTVPVITSPAQSQEFESDVRSITATWDSSIDDNGVSKYEISYEYTRNDSRVTDVRTVNGSTTSRDQSLSGNVLSDFIIRVRAQDNLGNWSDWSAPVTYYYGVPAPPPEPPEEPGPIDPIDPGLGEEEGEGGSGSGEANDLTTLQPAASALVTTTSATTSAAFAPVFNTDFIGNANTTEGDVLGTTTENNAKKAAQANVLSAQDEKENIFGIAWYWWLLILAAIIGLGYYVVTRKGLQQD